MLPLYSIRKNWYWGEFVAREKRSSLCREVGCVWPRTRMAAHQGKGKANGREWVLAHWLEYNRWFGPQRRIDALWRPHYDYGSCREWGQG